VDSASPAITRFAILADPEVEIPRSWTKWAMHVNPILGNFSFEWDVVI
jgi:hypothetical protein